MYFWFIIHSIMYAPMSLICHYYLFKPWLYQLSMAKIIFKYEYIIQLIVYDIFIIFVIFFFYVYIFIPFNIINNDKFNKINGLEINNKITNKTMIPQMNIQ